MSTVKILLSDKSTAVHTVSESATVLDAVKDMSMYRIGCLVVTREDGTISGIIAEQDVLRRMALEQEDISNLSVMDVMTTEVIVCSPADSLNTVRSIMKTHRLRQLPIVADDGRLVAIISMGDVNAHLITEEELEIKFLHDYIDGLVR